MHTVSIPALVTYNSYMAKDHYLPAAFIGRFSTNKSKRGRKRPIWVRSSKTDKILHTIPEEIGHEDGLYNLDNGSSIDKWSYESQLNRVLDSVAAGERITLDDYVRVAVPFVTGLFVRGKEFNKRYEAMPTINHLMAAGLLNKDNTNGSRSIRLQRMLAPVMGARWVVLHSNADVPIISNDIGLVRTKDLSNGDFGWAIPLDSRTILGIFPKKFDRIASYESGTWYADIAHEYPDQNIFQTLNQEIGKAANEFIFGATEDSIKNVQISQEKEPLDLAMVMEGGWNKTLSRYEYIAHEYEWYYLAAITNLNLSPDAAIEYRFNMKDVDLAAKWSPPSYIVTLGLSSFSSGIGINGNIMALNLNLLDDFESHIIHPLKQ